MAKGGFAKASTHEPLGDKHAQLPAYIANIAKALIADGHEEPSAIATAVSVCKRWAAGQGNVDKETRAAAAKAIAEWEALKVEHSKSKGGNKNQRVRSILAGG